MIKSGLNIKTVIVFIILLLVGVLGVLGVNTVRTYMSGAAVGVEPNNINALPNTDGKSATISWSTDKESQGVVEYGTTPASLLLRSVETDAATDHNLSLSPLKANTTYYYRIKVGEEVFDNSGIPYSFKTEAVVVSPTEMPEPTIAAMVTPPESSASDSGCNRTTDYNADGVVNSVDFVKCMQAGGKPAAVSTPVSSSSGSTTGDCNGGVDFDKNGIINSIDRIKCLQSKGL